MTDGLEHPIRIWLGAATIASIACAERVFPHGPGSGRFRCGAALTRRMRRSKRIPDAAGRSVSAFAFAVMQSARHSLIDFSAGQRKHYLPKNIWPRRRQPGLVSGPGRSGAVAVWEFAPNTTSNSISRCPMSTTYSRSSYPYPGGPSHHQDQRSSPLSCPGDLERP